MNQSTVTVTYTLGGMVRIYVDGELMGEMPQNGKAMEADDLILGHFEGKRYWTGDVYSIRFYDRELNAIEVAQNAEADAVKYLNGRLAPETTKAPEKSGCGSFVAVHVAIIAILGTALIVKKRD